MLIVTGQGDEVDVAAYFLDPIAQQVYLRLMAGDVAGRRPRRHCESSEGSQQLRKVRLSTQLTLNHVRKRELEHERSPAETRYHGFGPS